MNGLFADPLLGTDPQGWAEIDEKCENIRRFRANPNMVITSKYRVIIEYELRRFFPNELEAHRTVLSVLDRLSHGRARSMG